MPAVESDNIHCPKCSYNLTGLREPRCPECGQTFDPVWLRGMQRTYPGLRFVSPWRRWAFLYIAFVATASALVWLLTKDDIDFVLWGAALGIVTLCGAMAAALRWIGQEHL